MKTGISRVEELLDAIRGKKQYSFDTFCKENNLLKGTDVDRGSYTMISCPFHSDSTPSCKIDNSRWRFRCFSCGLSGDYVEFVRHYYNYALGFSMTRTQLMEKILKEDLSLQLELGFSSIYTGSSQITVEQIPEAIKLKFTRLPYTPTTFSELASYMQKHKCSKQQILFAISLMQSGSAPADIYREVFNVSSDTIYDLSELEG